jgi:hypothetical protein
MTRSGKLWRPLILPDPHCYLPKESENEGGWLLFIEIAEGPVFANGWTLSQEFIER